MYQSTRRCSCGPGYQEAATPKAPRGTVCVARCNLRSCRNEGSCQAAPDEDADVTCQCQDGYIGDKCEERLVDSSLAEWTVILIAVIAALAALTGLSLCGYAAYRLFCRQPIADDESDLSSIRDFKPSTISRADYDRMTNLGSWSKTNRALTKIIDEETESEQPVKTNGLTFDPKSISRLSNQSEHGDPTPALHPLNRTDRHSISEIVTQSDYY